MGTVYQALERAHGEQKMGLLRFPGYPAKETGYPAAGPDLSNLPALVGSDSLSDRFLSLKANESVKSIMFTAVSHGAGCTTSAVNFSLALARDLNRKVLLIDANLGRPAVHQFLAIRESRGLSDALADNESVIPAIKEVLPGKFYVLTSGKKRLPSGMFLRSEQFDQLLLAMKPEMDFIFVDAPPISIFPETRFLCPKMDGIILIIHSGKTRREAAVRAKELIIRAGGRVLGVVLNRREYYIPHWLYDLF